MKKTLLYVLAIICGLGLSSCDDFEPNGYLVPSLASNGNNNSNHEWKNSDILLNISGVELKMIYVQNGNNSFLIAETETTEKLYNAVMSKSGGSNMPMTGISVKEWQEFVQVIQKKSGLKFRFPREKEWVFAAKGGEKSLGYKFSGSDNIDDVAWYSGNSVGIHEVKLLLPNELGLYDMSGNLREMTEDYSFTDYGGGYTDDSQRCTTTSYTNTSGGTSHLRGLRLALSIDSTH